MIPSLPEMSLAAQWWAALEPEQRDALRAEFPDRLRPKGLQDECRKTHPDWAKKGKSAASPSGGSGRETPGLGKNGEIRGFRIIRKRPERPSQDQKAGRRAARR
jgi:hypothetical protein